MTRSVYPPGTKTLSMSHKPTKSDLKAAQAKHLADLFGDEAPQAGESQRAQDQQVARGAKLTQAAQAKQRQLSDQDAAKLDELREKAKPAAPAAPAVGPTPAPKPAPAAPSEEQPAAQPAPQAAAPRTGLHQLSDSNDLADAALRNMQAHLREQRQTPPPQPAPSDTAPAESQADASAQTAATQPTPDTQPDPARPPRQKRPAPSPEELDRLLKSMAARSRRARQSSGAAPASAPMPRPSMPGAGESAPDAAPQIESPPDVPEEAPERNQEKQAEILKGLQEREATAQQQIPQIPAGDQQRAAVEPVEVKVPIVTDDNAVSAAPLHEALADLAAQMGAKNAPGQVDGANRVQRNMPGHPLYNPDESGQTGGSRG